MHSSIATVTAFFADNVPSPRVLALGGPPALAWAWLCLRFAAWLKWRRGWRTGYTRKIFHFLIFGSVVAIGTIWSTRGVCL